MVVDGGWPLKMPVEQQVLAEPPGTFIAGVLTDIVITFSGDQEADRGVPRVDTRVEEDFGQELKFTADFGRHESCGAAVPDYPGDLPGPEVVFWATCGVVEKRVSVQYHLFELIGMPKAFGIAMDEMIHGMEQV